MSEEQKDKISEQSKPIEWRDFLQEHPPGGFALVANAVKKMATPGTGPDLVQLTQPDLHLHCPEETCNSRMFFRGAGDGVVRLSESTVENVYLTYWCRNCGRYNKTFSVFVSLLPDRSLLCQAYKFGEYPSFGPPIPSRALRLIQPDYELFLKGRTCENQGLGVGAFAYYRRVVENQWIRLVEEIIRVGKAIKASDETISDLESLKDEKQFTKAVKSIGHGIPPVLEINGHNPLVLLHRALSQGVHNLNDEECLVLATSVRVVLVELAEKLGQALKDEKELTDAVSHLLQVKSKN